MKFRINNEQCLVINQGEFYLQGVDPGIELGSLSLDTLFNSMDHLKSNFTDFYHWDSSVISKSGEYILSFNHSGFVCDKVVRNSNIQVDSEVVNKLYNSLKTYLTLLTCEMEFSIGSNGNRSLKVYGKFESTVLNCGNYYNDVKSHEFRSNLEKLIKKSNKYYKSGNRTYLVNDEYSVKLWMGEYVKLPYILIPEDSTEVTEKEFLIAIDEIIDILWS